MAVYVAASDESEGPRQIGPFVYGGFVGPNRDWIDWFTPAWEERVLNAKPPIPFFHMAEIRNAKWQAANGITAIDAERRIDEAVRVVASSGSIKLVRTMFDGGYFRQTFGSVRAIRRGEQYGSYPFDPDYVGFLGFARGVLQFVHLNHPDAESVDFIVERKTRVSHYMPDYLDMLEKWLASNGQQELVDLIGDLIPGDKRRVPLQAADLAMWHIRRKEAGELQPVDYLRLHKMFDGRLITLSGIQNHEMATIAARIAARHLGEHLNGGAS